MKDFTIDKKFLKKNGMSEYNDVFIALEKLRQIGAINMFGAVPYIRAQFENITQNEAVKILDFYIENYDNIYYFKK